MKLYRRMGVAGLCLAIALGSTGCGSKKEESRGFEPRLDTEATLTLSVTGFFGNFEALDAVTNDFNQYYPNVSFSYEQVGGDSFASYLEANPNLDIMMTSEANFAKPDSKLKESCVDLSKENIDLQAIEEDMLQMGYHDGELSCIPMGQNVYGLVVNVSLLEKEGLSVPENAEEFLQTLHALKEKGYTPIQGPEKKIYAELTESMAFDLLLQDETAYQGLLAGKEEAADVLLPVFDKLDQILENDFTDTAVNETYPDDNYDQAILKFFEGDVPFWVCNTEKVSGMKKRESKSEAYTANPFTYTYISVPLGEKGVYSYQEPWFGFAVNRDGANKDYAVEFIRFLATKDEINQMADIKGIPSVAVEKTTPEIYQNIFNPKATELSCVNEGKITPDMVSAWYACVNQYVTGEFATAREALAYFTGVCSGQITTE